MSRRKKATAALALALTAALLVGGVFAWTDFSQAFRNIFRQNPSPDVILHDDFTPEKNKDVYVENPAGGVPVVVRLSFYEFLQIGNEVIVPSQEITVPDPENANQTIDRLAKPTDVNNKDIYVKHLFGDADDAENTSKYPNKAWVNNEGTIEASADPNGTHALWDLEGETVPVLPSNLTRENETSLYYTWYMTGNQKIYLPGTQEIDDINWTQTGVEGPNGFSTKKTAAASPIISMAEYITLETEERAQLPACWILDTDGYAYWSRPLQPNTATNLLLDNVVRKTKQADDNTYYAIDVRMQATNVTEAGQLWYGDKGDSGNEDITENAKALLNDITGGVSPVKSFKVDYPLYTQADHATALTQYWPWTETEIENDQSFNHQYTTADDNSSYRHFRATVAGNNVEDKADWTVTATDDGDLDEQILLSETITDPEKKETVNASWLTTVSTVDGQYDVTTLTAKQVRVFIPEGYDGTITITATAVADAGFTRTFTIVVDSTVPTVADHKTLSNPEGDGGSDWLEIATIEVDGTNYSLIVRKKVLTNSAGAFGATNNYMKSDVRTQINDWYASLDSNNELVTFAASNNIKERLGTTFAWVGDGISLPTGDAIGREDIAFALSSGEAKLFASRNYYTPFKIAERATNHISQSGTAPDNNWVQLGSSNNGDANSVLSWLRSPGAAATYAAVLSAHGYVGNDGLSCAYSVRPALWVKSDIFN
jgi:hypothetical protein